MHEYILDIYTLLSLSYKEEYDICLLTYLPSIMLKYMLWRWITSRSTLTFLKQRGCLALPITNGFSWMHCMQA